MKQLSTLLTCIGISQLPLSAAVYIPPNSAAVFLKLDQVTLDQERMQRLSSTLVQLALEPNERTPKQLRACAQLLALANQLDPSNQAVEQANQALLRGSQNAHSEAAPHLKSNKRKLWTVLDYLSSSPQDSQNFELAQRVKQSLHTLTPELPQLEEFSAVSLNWDDIVEPLSAFDKDPANELINTSRVEHLAEETIAKPTDAIAVVDSFFDELDSAPPTKELLKWNKNKLTVKAPVRFKRPNTPSTKGIATYAITLTPKPDEKPNTVSLGSNAFRIPSDKQSKISQTLSSIMKGQVEQEFQSVTLYGRGKQQLDTKSSLSVSTAAFSVVLKASLMNYDLAPNLVVASGIDSKGRFFRDKQFWGNLSSLLELEGEHRILVAPTTEGDLKQVLATTDGRFFVTHEIFSVDTLDKTNSLAQTPLNKDFAKASSLFDEVQYIMKGKTPFSLARNQHVRNKLREIYKLNPNHLSAKMLLILGSSVNKPNKVEPAYIAFEVQDILSNVEAELSKNSYSLKADSLLKLSESTKEKVQAISRLVRSEDKEIIELTEDVSDLLRSAGKSKEKSKNYFSNSRDYHSRSFNDDVKKLKQLLNTIKVKTAEMTKEVNELSNN